MLVEFPKNIIIKILKYYANIKNSYSKYYILYNCRIVYKESIYPSIYTTVYNIYIIIDR